MINEFIEMGGEVGKCEGSGYGWIVLYVVINLCKGVL